MTDPRVLSAAHNPSVLARNSVDIMNFRSKTKVLCRFSGGATMVFAPPPIQQWSPEVGPNRPHLNFKGRTDTDVDAI